MASNTTPINNKPQLNPSVQNRNPPSWAEKIKSQNESVSENGGFQKVIPKSKLVKVKNFNGDKKSVVFFTEPKNSIPKNLMFKSTWILWEHPMKSNDWSAKSYNQIYAVNSVPRFWRLFNNSQYLGFRTRYLFLMREGILPTWEDPNNRLGGICSFKIELENTIDMFKDLAFYLVTETLTDKPNDINGISISIKGITVNQKNVFSGSKNVWAIVKIWNRDSKNDISKDLRDDIAVRCKEFGAVYKPCKPEY
jgi:hypothetical protein